MEDQFYSTILITGSALTVVALVLSFIAIRESLRTKEYFFICASLWFSVALFNAAAAGSNGKGGFVMGTVALGIVALLFFWIAANSRSA